MVYVFVVDKRVHKICCSTKDTEITSLMPLGLKPQRVIKGAGFFMWDVLLPTAEDCLEMARRELITENLILRTEYDDRRSTRVTTFEVLLHAPGEHLAVFFMEYGQILSVTSDHLSGGWNFDIMLDRLVFVFDPNCLNFCGRDM